MKSTITKTFKAEVLEESRIRLSRFAPTVFEQPTGQSPWTEKVPLEKRYPSLAGERHAEIAIIGGGVLGLLLMDRLARNGHKVALLDGFRIAAGNTSQMGGIVTRALDPMYTDLQRKLGRESVKRLSEISRSGQLDIQALARQIPSSTVYKDQQSFFVSYRHHDPTLRSEWNVLRTVDDNLKFVSGKAASAILPQVKEAIVFDNEGTLDIRRFLIGLMEPFRGATHMHIFEDSQVESVDTVGSKVHVRTSDGVIIADKAIITSLLPIDRQSHSAPLLNPLRVYACSATVPDNVAMPKGNMFDTEAPLNFYRPIGEREILFGGGDSPTVEAVGGDEKLPLLHKLFPGSEINRHWTGIINETPDGLPYFDRLPAAPDRVVVASGLGGTGLVFSGIGRSIVPILLEGKEHPYPELFSIARKGF